MKFFATPWPHVSTIAVVDILLVAVIIYELLALIKGTRAAYMLVGVAGLALVFYFSRAGELTTLNWLLSTLLPYAVFALIVIFAGEIRQALARLGRRLLLSRMATAEADAYDDIVLAANLFCQNQTGALIVIEREIGLRTYIESGVPLDARLSYDLLATIFRPSAPLHDGAVIVQKDRIAAAACFLPLRCLSRRHIKALTGFDMSSEATAEDGFGRAMQGFPARRGASSSMAVRQRLVGASHQAT